MNITDESDPADEIEHVYRIPILGHIEVYLALDGTEDPEADESFRKAIALANDYLSELEFTGTGRTEVNDWQVNAVRAATRGSYVLGFVPEAEYGGDAR